MATASRPPPEVFGKYLLDEEIGRGGMARVFRARLRGVGGFEKTLVIKQILPELARDPRFLRMFVDEAKVLVQMSHPHLVPVYELGAVDGVYFLAMEYVEGATLGQMVREGGALEAPAVAHIGAQVADALHYAHGRFGLVHRDVTSGNVIVDGVGHARLLDFGVASPLVGSRDAERAVFGTPGYAAPEELRGEPAGPASDLFGLAASLREALAGEGPATGQRAGAGDLDSIPGVPSELAEILGPCLADDPAARPATADEVARALRGFLGRHHPEGVTDHLGARADATRRARESRRRRRRALRRSQLRSDPSGVVRSIATSPVLDAALAAERVGALPPPWGATGSGAPPETAVPHPAPIPTEAFRVARTRRLPGRRGARRRASSLAAAAVLVAALAGLAAARFGLLDRASDAPGAPRRTEDGRSEDGALPAEVRGEPSPPSAPLPEGLAPPSPAAGAPPPPAAPPAAGRRRAAPPAKDRQPGKGPRASASPDAASPPGASALRRVVVTAIPWAEVELDGRPVGNTPLRQLAVPPGVHRLVLRCPPLGRETEVRIDLAPDAAPLRVAADLTREPVQVDVR